MRWELIHQRSAGLHYPEPRFDGTTWYCDQGLWLFGGQCSIDDPAQLSDLWRFDLSALEWTAIPPNLRDASASYNTPSGRLGAAHWIERSELVMYGGAVDHNPSSDLWRFDTQRCRWINVECAKQPGESTPGVRSSAVAWDDGVSHAWLFGGIAESSPGCRGIFGDLWRYSFDAGSWRLEATGNNASRSLPSPRTRASYCVSSKSCWVFGGFDRSSPRETGLSDLWSFDRITGEAKQWWDADLDSGSGPSPRSGAVLFADQADNLYVFGGQQRQSRQNLDDLWKFELSSRNWSQLACSHPSPTPRTESCSWVDGTGNLWMFGGYETSASELGELWLLRA